MSDSPSWSRHRQKAKDAAILSGKTVCIMGRSAIHDQALASCLERETGAKCVLVEDTGNILTTASPQLAALPTLMLWDCREKYPKSLPEEVRLCVMQKPSGCKVLLLNVRRLWGIERQLVESGISGFFYTEDPLGMVLNGIRAVVNGELWFSRKVMSDCILEGRERAGALRKHSGVLTPRQMEIVALVAVGATNDEIADKLRISPHTVKTHLYQLFKKINVPNRMQAALWAAQNL